jgi:hypothetical protein
MIIFGFGIFWIGYQQTIYGWVLLKGWDIRWRDLANPIRPYQWPAPPNQPPTIPVTAILPTGASSPATAAAAKQGGGQTALAV